MSIVVARVSVVIVATVVVLRFAPVPDRARVFWRQVIEWRRI
jgi:hypothetical protein